MGQQFLAQLRAHVSTNLCWCSHMGPYGLAGGGEYSYTYFTFLEVLLIEIIPFWNYLNVFKMFKGI